MLNNVSDTSPPVLSRSPKVTNCPNELMENTLASPGSLDLDRFSGLEAMISP